MNLLGQYGEGFQKLGRNGIGFTIGQASSTQSRMNYEQRREADRCAQGQRQVNKLIVCDPRVTKVCIECARNEGGSPITAHIGQLHIDTCQQCGHTRFVNSPKNFIWRKPGETVRSS